MKKFVETRIPEEYEILCAVNKIEGTTLFTDAFIESLFFTMEEKWLPLKAFRRVVWEESQEERLYLAYNPKIIDRSRVGEIETEIRNFTLAIFPKVKIIASGDVYPKIRTNYNEVVKINNDDIVHWNFKVSDYYKPYLLSLGRNEEEANKEIKILKCLPDYKWYRIKNSYIGNVGMPNDIDKFLDEFICLNRDDSLQRTIEAFKSYNLFHVKKEKCFSKEYENQKKREALDEKVKKNEIQIIDSTIDINDYEDFLRWFPNQYDTRNKWLTINELLKHGWNDKYINGYKEGNEFFIFEGDMSNFISDDYYLRSWRIGSLQAAMQKYLQFKWERDHPTNKTKKVQMLNETPRQEEKELDTKKKIRIDIVMDDLEDFLDFLERRDINRQSRKRYVEAFKDLYKNGWNAHKHSTFIDNNRYVVNTKDIEVFVNGLKTRDFNVTLKEYEESLGLYLTYRWEKNYQRPKQDIKVEAVQPIVKEREKIEKKQTENTDNSDGKKIFVNIAHIDEYKSSKSESVKILDDPSVIYVGEPEKEHKNKTMQVSSIIEDDEKVTVSINFGRKDIITDKENELKKESNVGENTKKESSPKDEPEAEVSSEKTQNNVKHIEIKEEKTSLFKMVKMVFLHFGDFVQMIYKNVFYKK